MVHALGDGLVDFAYRFVVHCGSGSHITRSDGCIETLKSGFDAGLDHAVTQVFGVGDFCALQRGLDIGQTIHPLIS